MKVPQVVLSLVAVACGSAQVLNYPGLYGNIPWSYLGSNLGRYYQNPLIRDVTLKAADTEINPIRVLEAYPYPLRYGASPLTYNYPAISAIGASPLAYNIPSAAPIQTQYRAQDEFGQYQFSFAGGPSSRSEMRDVFGNVRGSFNYIDAEGELQTQTYVSDAKGFRVEATNLPVAPEVPEVPAPQPVQYTPEVAAARAEFQAAYSKAAAAAAAPAADEAPAAPAEVSEPKPESRKKRSIAALPSFTSPLGFSPLQYSYPSFMSRAFPYSPIAGLSNLAYTAPGITAYSGIPALTTYNAASPAMVRNAEMLKIKNNPGHATSYRVY